MEDLKFSGVEAHYIFPFLFDTNLVKEPFLKFSRSKLGFSKGLPPEHVGFLPLLPYKNLEEGVVHKGPDLLYQNIELIQREKEKHHVPVEVKKTFIIRDSGAGSLTYSIKFLKEEIKFSELKSLFNMVPKTKERNLYLLNNKTLQKQVYDDIKGLAKKFPTKREKDQKFLEDEEVLVFTEGYPHPYVYYILEMEPTLYSHFFSHKEDYKQELTAIIYSFENLDDYKNIIEKDILERVSALKDFVFKNACLSKKIYTILHHWCSLSIFNKEVFHDYVKKNIIPTIFNALEHVVCREHFALILDALLDNLQNRILSASYSELYEFRKYFYQYEHQVAVFLENLGQYAKSGFMGGDFMDYLDKIFDMERLQDRILSKLELTEKIFDNIAKYKVVKGFPETVDEAFIKSDERDENK